MQCCAFWERVQWQMRVRVKYGEIDFHRPIGRQTNQALRKHRIRTWQHMHRSWEVFCVVCCVCWLMCCSMLRGCVYVSMWVQWKKGLRAQWNSVDFFDRSIHTGTRQTQFTRHRHSLSHFGHATFKTWNKKKNPKRNARALKHKESTHTRTRVDKRNVGTAQETHPFDGSRLQCVVFSALSSPSSSSSSCDINPVPVRNIRYKARTSTGYISALCNLAAGVRLCVCWRVIWRVVVVSSSNFRRLMCVYIYNTIDSVQIGCVRAQSLITTTHTHKNVYILQRLSSRRPMMTTNRE